MYNFILGDVTKLCYRNCLDYFQDGAAVLDVGIGNALMLEKNHELIRQKGLRITGLDVNERYIEQARERVQRYGMQNQIQAHHCGVEEFRPPHKEGFDYVLFSMSFMLLSQQKEILERIRNWLAPQGEVVFFQTMFQDKSILIDWIKPRLKYITSVDFGEAVYEADFFQLLRSSGFTVTRDRMLKRNWLKAQYRMIAATL